MFVALIPHDWGIMMSSFLKESLYFMSTLPCEKGYNSPLETKEICSNTINVPGILLP